MTLIMRYPEGHKAQVKQRIVQEASRALRKSGLAGISIPSLMKKAGLTHGGFYAHFRDRDELVAQAIRSAAQETAASVLSPELSPAESLNRYLSMAHVTHPEGGCVLAALGTDAAHQPARVRAAFSDVAQGFLQLNEHKVHAQNPNDTPSDAALLQAATMVGAVILARLVKDPVLAERILAAARAR